MNRLVAVSTLVIALAVDVAVASAEPFALEDYAQLPSVRHFAMSPNGVHVAYIRRSAKGDYLVVGDIDSGYRLGGASSRSIDVQSVQFVTDTQVLLRGEKERSSKNRGSAWDAAPATLYDIETRSLRALPGDAERSGPNPVGLGKLVGFNKAQNELIVSAHIKSKRYAYSLAHVHLDQRRTRFTYDGSRYTSEVFTDRDGNLIAKEAFDKNKNLLQVFARSDNDWRLVHEEEKRVPGAFAKAVSADAKNLVFSRSEASEEGVYTLSLDDGTIEGPLHVENGADIKRLIISGLNRTFAGVEYAGLMDSSMYLDSTIDAQFRAVSEFFPGSSIERVAASEDGAQSIYFVSGNKAANRYYVLDAATMKLNILGQEYPGIGEEHIGEIKAVKYKARDGQSIGAVVTWPVDVTKTENLPLIVLPHDAPDGYSSVRFDWLAQFFARTGYVVLQPNFRGSGGFGKRFAEAGAQQQGAVMHNDIVDGVAAMVDAGHVNPDKVCIVGSFYGGHVALASAALNPDNYRCAVAVGGVFDVPRLLKNASSNQAGSLTRVSPVDKVNQINSPVLLLHYKNDDDVPVSQSKSMHKTLVKAGKASSLVILSDEESRTVERAGRLELLTEIAKFLNAHNPVNGAAKKAVLNSAE